MKRLKKFVRRTLGIALIGFVFLNIIAIFHAYKFTHFASGNPDKTRSPEKLGTIDKIKTALFGINNPRPTNRQKPSRYTDVQIQSNKKIDCWYLNNLDSPSGTVILFHGYSGEKSSMLDKAEVFEKLNYNVLLVDFMGSGGSEDNQTTLGFKEAEEVKTVYDFLSQNGVRHIYLFGTSMGSVAILKAISEYNLKPEGIIVECPFGSMYTTVCARFNTMNMPTFPMAGLLVLWGGLQNGFWAFKHNPTEYAKKVWCPALLLYGEKDRNVSRAEIDEIYKNLQGNKVLKTYKLAGHENYLSKYKKEWTKDVSEFLHIKR